MTIFRIIIKDLFIFSLITWLFLLFLEFSRPGTVHRFVNLEYGFYFLLLLSLIIKLVNRAKR